MTWAGLDKGWASMMGSSLRERWLLVPWGKRLELGRRRVECSAMAGVLELQNPWLDSRRVVRFSDDGNRPLPRGK